MKKFTFSFKSLLVAAGLLLGSANAWAQDPVPVYFNDFSSTTGLTIEGSGEFIDDADARFGQIYHNNPAANADRRSNYLLLPEDVLTHSGTSNAMTIGFWVNRKSDTGYTYCPLFSAYKTTTPGVNNGSPMFICQSRGLLQVNDGAGNWSDFAAAQNDKGTNAESTTWLDDNEWHYYTVTLTSTTAKVYVDGVIVNSWTMDGTSDGQVISGLFSAGAADNLPKVCLGGNQAWGWDDKDASFGFDDFAVYDVALTAEQIEQIIDTKLGRTTVYKRTLTGTTAWSASDAAASGSDLNVWYGNMGYNETYGIYGSANGNRSSVMTFSHTANSIQTFDIVFNNLGNTGNSGNYSYIKIGSDIEIRSNQQDQNGAVIINGSSTAISDCNQKGYNRGGDSWTIHVEINTAEKKVTAFTLVGTTMNGKSAHYTMASETALSSSATFNTVTIGFVRAAGNPSTALSSIIIKEQAQAVTNVDYTINYKLGENLVKTVSDEGVVGTVITADAAIDGTEGIYVGNHYLIVAAEAPSMTLVDGENILDVPVRAPYTATLNVTKTIGGVAQTPVVTNLVETDAKVCSWNYVYSLYIQKDGVYYVADETSSFGESGTFTNGEIINKTVAYTNPDYAVVYYGEPNEATGTNTVYSNGATGFITGGVTYDKNNVIRLGVLPAGKYRLITNVVDRPDRNVVVGDCSNTSVFPTALVTITTSGAKDEEFTLATATPISISGKDQGGGKFNQSAGVDYILVKAATVPVEISGAGYATFSSAYPLDLTTANTPAGLEAYYVGSEGVGATSVSLTAINQTVAANEGILFKGTANATYNIPVVASGTALSGNQLIATDGSDVATGNFVFAYVTGTFANPGFYTLTAATAVAAGKAYLKKPAGVKAMFLPFDGTATGVDAPVVAEAEEDGVLYNTSGQQVTEDYKGIVIKNGKKYLNK